MALTGRQACSGGCAIDVPVIITRGFRPSHVLSANGAIQLKPGAAALGKWMETRGSAESAIQRTNITGTYFSRGEVLPQRIIEIANLNRAFSARLSELCIPGALALGWN
jgi:hypothetical protein